MQQKRKKMGLSPFSLQIPSFTNESLQSSGYVT